MFTRRLAGTSFFVRIIEEQTEQQIEPLVRRFLTQPRKWNAQKNKTFLTDGDLAEISVKQKHNQEYLLEVKCKKHLDFKIRREWLEDSFKLTFYGRNEVKFGLNALDFDARYAIITSGNIKPAFELLMRRQCRAALEMVREKNTTSEKVLHCMLLCLEGKKAEAEKELRCIENDLEKPNETQQLLLNQVSNSLLRVSIDSLQFGSESDIECKKISKFQKEFSNWICQTRHLLRSIQNKQFCECLAAKLLFELRRTQTKYLIHWLSQTHDKSQIVHQKIQETFRSMKKIVTDTGSRHLSIFFNVDQWRYQQVCNEGKKAQFFFEKGEKEQKDLSWQLYPFELYRKEVQHPLKSKAEERLILHLKGSNYRSLEPSLKLKMEFMGNKPSDLPFIDQEYSAQCTENSFKTQFDLQFPSNQESSEIYIGQNREDSLYTLSPRVFQQHYYPQKEKKKKSNKKNSNINEHNSKRSIDYWSDSLDEDENIEKKSKIERKEE